MFNNLYDKESGNSENFVNYYKSCGGEFSIDLMRMRKKMELIRINTESSKRDLIFFAPPTRQWHFYGQNLYKYT
ncbi:MAG: hypothetical protein F6K08_08120 [Okeania sp. SIO1H6]|nr:hypothetical protein [Okeania sp. SIO1H6]